MSTTESDPVSGFTEAIARRYGPRMALRPPELAEVLGCGISKAYELVRSGAIRSTKHDRAVFVPVSAVVEFLEGRDVEVAS